MVNHVYCAFQDKSLISESYHQGILICCSNSNNRKKRVGKNIWKTAKITSKPLIVITEFWVPNQKVKFANKTDREIYTVERALVHCWVSCS